ncbi:hypothetical protein CAL7716_052720 [Calothrix sp. PCC 7716]|nr:hypothetical protein CAL7716_052720 [Calothrix sp. PCC 7716]
MQRRAASQDEISEVPPIVHEVLHSPGQPLDKETRGFMESRFRHDFSQVRVHTDSKASNSALAVKALAYTVGQHITFLEGRYTPTTTVGKRLLAHELAHVVQQSRGGVQPSLSAVSAHERSADLAASAVMAGQTSVAVQGATGIGLARQAMTADELLQFMLSQRGFASSSPGAPSSQELAPGRVGRDMGQGYQTFAAVQITDASGRHIRTSIGAYLGSGAAHAESEAVTALRSGLPSGVNLQGGRMTVAVDQVPCSGCDSALRRLAQDLRLEQLEIYVPSRASTRDAARPVAPKTAARGAFRADRPAVTAQLHTSIRFPRPGSSGQTGGTTPPPAIPSRVPSSPRRLTMAQRQTLAQGSVMAVQLAGQTLASIATEVQRRRAEQELRQITPRIQATMEASSDRGVVIGMLFTQIDPNRVDPSVRGQISERFHWIDFSSGRTKQEATTAWWRNKGGLIYSGEGEIEVIYFQWIPPISSSEQPESWRYYGGSPVTCFIATACYGSPLASEVCLLREFRDMILQRSHLGQAFIKLYYQISPPIAEFLGCHQHWRTLVRQAMIAPLVSVVRVSKKWWHPSNN